MELLENIFGKLVYTFQKQHANNCLQLLMLNIPLLFSIVLEEFTENSQITTTTQKIMETNFPTQQTSELCGENAPTRQDNGHCEHNYTNILNSGRSPFFIHNIVKNNSLNEKRHTTMTSEGKKQATVDNGQFVVPSRIIGPWWQKWRWQKLSKAAYKEIGSEAISEGKVDQTKFRTENALKRRFFGDKNPKNPANISQQQQVLWPIDAKYCDDQCERFPEQEIQLETNNHSTGWMDKEREQNLQTTTAPASTLNPFTKNVDKYANGTKVNINNGMEQKNKQRGDAHKGEEAIDEAMPFRDQFAHNLFTAVANTAMNASIDSIDAFTQFRNQSDAEKELFPLPPTVNSFASANFQAEEDAIMSNASQALAANRSGITHRQFGLPLFLHGKRRNEGSSVQINDVKDVETIFDAKTMTRNRRKQNIELSGMLAEEGTVGVDVAALSKKLNMSEAELAKRLRLAGAPLLLKTTAAVKNSTLLKAPKNGSPPPQINRSGQQQMKQTAPANAADAKKVRPKSVMSMPTIKKMGQKILHAIGFEPKTATVTPWNNFSKLVTTSNGRKKANENEKSMETSRALILRDHTFQNKKRENANVISNSRKSFDHRKFVQKQTASVAPKFGVYSPTASVGNRKKQKQKQQSVILNVFRKKATASQRENQFISIARKRNKKTEVDVDDVELLSPTSGV